MIGKNNENLHRSKVSQEGLKRFKLDLSNFEVSCSGQLSMKKVL